MVLVAFLVSFLAIRTSARLTRAVSWWPGGVKSGNVHIHHLVWGICLLMFSGFVAFAAPLDDPWWHIIAVTFGIGVGFTLDEFALWVRLEDVYWAEEGRASLDAVVVATAFAALVVVGTNPFGLDDPVSIAGTVVVVTAVLGLGVVCFLKGRVLLGVVGLFIPAVALFGAVRLYTIVGLGTPAVLRPQLARACGTGSVLPSRQPLAAARSPTSWPVRPVRKWKQRQHRCLQGKTNRTPD